MSLRIGFLISHPIQYWTPILRELDKRCDLSVYFAHRQTAEQQASAGFGVPFDWDTDLLSGYRNEFLPNISRHPAADSFWGCNTPEIARKIGDGRFDGFVVPGWALWSYWQAALACQRSGVPILVRGDSQLASERRGVRRIVKALIFRRMLRHFDGFLHVGQRNRQYLLHYGVPPERLFFSPHCVDNDGFRSASEAVRRSTGAAKAKGSRRVLFVGKLTAHKRPQDLLRAAKLLRERGVDLELTFAGAGELAGELARFAQEAALSVEWRGFVNQSGLPGVYAEADALVLPSESETWGLVVNEAMACGVPTVVSDTVGCAPDLVVPGVTGETFPCRDIAALARAIETVLSGDREDQRRRTTDRIAAYSPAAAAEGVLEAVATLRR